MTLLNESAVSLAWLLRFLNESESAALSPASSADLLQHQWRAVSEAMRADSMPSEIDSDIWLCKSQMIEHGVLRGGWRPPDSLDDFAPGLLGRNALERWNARLTQSSRLDDLIADQPSFPDEQFLVRTNIAVQSYRRLYEATAPPFVRPEQKRLIVMLNQILPWLNIAIGAPLRGIVLSPFNTPEELRVLAQTADQRIAAVAESDDRDPYLERALLCVYNIRSFQPNQPFSSLPTRSGQSEVWREQWGWLTQDAAADDARTAIVTAAQMLANIAIVAPLNALAKGIQPKTFDGSSLLASSLDPDVACDDVGGGRAAKRVATCEASGRALLRLRLVEAKLAATHDCAEPQVEHGQAAAVSDTVLEFALSSHRRYFCSAVGNQPRHDLGNFRADSDDRAHEVNSLRAVGMVSARIGAPGLSGRSMRLHARQVSHRCSGIRCKKPGQPANGGKPSGGSLAGAGSTNSTSDAE